MVRVVQVTPSLLSHPLILKYFRHCQSDWCDCDGWTATIAQNVIRAMETKIKKGERYISLDGFVEEVARVEMADSHFYCLRLPDQFQPEREKRECDCTQGRCRHGNFIGGGSQIGQPPSTAGCGCKGCDSQGLMSSACICPCHKKPDQAKCRVPAHTCRTDCIPDIHDVAPEAEAGRPMLDAVEENVNDILVAINEGIYTKNYFEKRLRELVAIVRGEKK
jgi:hypothetical protein